MAETRSATRDPRFLIIGAGMSGILSAIKLQEAGLTDFTVYEKADRLGGTWRENAYPGISCDVPSHLYCYSFAPKPDWSHRFSPGAEIQAYFEEVARRYGVDKFIKYGQEITRCRFEDGRWHLETADGTTDEGDFVIAATGVLHHPSYPDIEGLDSFEGSCFHSARWDHDVTVEDKRIGVIWHTTGSGKSLSMAFLVGILRKHPELENPTFVVQVDRNDLDNQLHDQFVAVRSLVGDVKQADSGRFFRPSGD